MTHAPRDPIEELVSEWWSVRRTTPTRASELAALPASGRVISHDNKPRTRAIALGKAVAAEVGRTVGAWRIDRAEAGDVAVTAKWYQLALVGPEPVAAPPAAEQGIEPAAGPRSPAAQLITSPPATDESPRRRARRVAQENAANLQDLIRSRIAALSARASTDLEDCQTILCLARSFADSVKGAALAFVRRAGETRKRLPSKVVRERIPLPASPGAAAAPTVAACDGAASAARSGAIDPEPGGRQVTPEESFEELEQVTGDPVEAEIHRQIGEDSAHGSGQGPAPAGSVAPLGPSTWENAGEDRRKAAILRAIQRQRELNRATGKSD